jgi:hypothetical protein
MGSLLNLIVLEKINHVKMKNAFFLVFSLFLSTSVIAQAPKSKVVSISVPNDAISLTKEQASKVIHANFKRSGIPMDVENYYQLNGYVISFWDREEDPSPESQKSLEEIKLAILHIMKNTPDTVNFGKIITVNNIPFFVYEYQRENEVSLRFQTGYRNNKTFGGIIQFKKPDEEKAQKTLQELLESIHFKE